MPKIIPELEKLIDAGPIKVGSDGFVRLVDYMGDDSSIAQAARVSYGDGTAKVSKDEGLIRYLMRHWHTTPFEMCEIKLHVRVPMDCWRQWIRHRTANVNEYSTRYSKAIDSAQTTSKNAWRVQTKSNKQGSEGFLDDTLGLLHSVKEANLQKRAREVYESRLKDGIAREQARKDLPLSTYTEAYWKIDLHNLLHFLWLRMDSHSQLEIRDYATVIGEQIVSKWVPLTWNAFKEYRINGIHLTGRDIDIINCMNTSYVPAEEFGWLEKSKRTGKLKRNRERDECEMKLRMLGLPVPWEGI